MRQLTVFNHILFFLLLFNIPVSSEQNNNQKNSPELDVIEALEKFNEDYYHQKIYLHTDKNNYMAGENIWFSAYVLNAIDHIPDENSKNLNVELLTPDNEFVSISLLQVHNGHSYGNINIPDSLSEGNYFLRAYTDWMRNFDDDFYYEKELYVYNHIEKNFIRFWDILRNRRYNRTLENKQNEMQFAVFPEGGDLVDNLANRVAFKATNTLGAGQEAQGKILDSNDNTVEEFETFHDGMGVFTFTPEPGKEYKAEVNFNNGEELTYSLPESLEQGYLLKTNILDDNIEIKIKPNFDSQQYNIDPEMTIAAHTRGNLIVHENVKIQNEEYEFSIPKDKFPTGVSHITLLDGNKLPIAERLIFINHEDIKQASLKNIDEDSLNIEFEGYSDNDVSSGNYSISIVNPIGKEFAHETNIASYLLLESDISSTIKNPWYYLSDTTEEVEKALDLLMMTHGWRRFEWNNVLANDFPEIKHEHSIGIEISGQLLTRDQSRPLKNVPVELAIEQDVMDIYSTKTTSDGRFSFEGLHYEEDFDVNLTPGETREQVTIDLDEIKYEEADYSKSFLSRPRQVLSRGDDWSLTSRPDVTVEPFKKPDFEVERPRSPHGQPDQVIYMDELPSGYSRLNEALRGRLISLGANASFEASTEPLYMLDGNAISTSAFMSLQPQNIERVEVFRGASTSSFGVRGANGVIIAYTKTRSSEQKPEFKFEYQGYEKTKEFYQSRINTEKYEDAGINKTLFWNPQISPDHTGKASIELPENINLNNSIIIIEGINNKGKITFSKEKLN